MSLAKRLLKAGAKNNQASVLSNSKFFDQNEPIETPVYALNIAHSGSIHKGFEPGLMMLAGESKHFKSGFMLVHAKAYMDKYEDSIMIFYDSEFGSSAKYFENAGIDNDRVLHIPIKNVEDLKFDIMLKLQEIEKDVHAGETPRIIICIDSVGNLASKKEVEDAVDEKSVADMTRAKQMKSLWRMVTPYLTMCRIPCIAINHTYKTLALHSTSVVGGGTGGIYSSNTIFIIGRRQIKEGTEVTGWSFILNAEKSRNIKEKSAIPVEVTFDGGINRFSGLLEIALLTGHVTKPKNGWYTRPSVEDDKNWRKAASDSREFWDPIINDPTFDKEVGELFKIGGKRLLTEEMIETVDSDITSYQVDEETGELLNFSE